MLKINKDDDECVYPIGRKPKVYIILVNWNGWSDTIECLESILGNDYFNYQIVVVDNDSNDNSVSKIIEWSSSVTPVFIETPFMKRYCDIPRFPIPCVVYDRLQGELGGNNNLENTNCYSSYGPKYPIVIIKSGSNLGYAGGNNVGIKYSLAKGDADFIWLLNNDTVIHHHALTTMVEVAVTHSSVGMVGSKLLYYHIPKVIQVLGGTHRVGWKNTGRWIQTQMKDSDTMQENFEVGGYLCGASILASSEVIKKVGLLNEDYFMWVEEVDWCLRTRNCGFKLYCCTNSRVWHKEGASTGKGRIASFLGRKSPRVSFRRFVITTYYDIRNRMYFVKKYFPSKFNTFLIYIFVSCVKRSLGVLLYDDHKLWRIHLLFNAFRDGLMGKIGEFDIPLKWR